jgi:hypothetical protein
MFIQGLLPAAQATWKAWRASRQLNIEVGCRTCASIGITAKETIELPPGMIALGPETQTVLTAASSFARNRRVLLNVTVEPHLYAQADAPSYRTYLYHRVFGAINRADSGVLVTVIRCGDSVEIAVLDDGTNAAHDDTATDRPPALPQGSTVVATYKPHHGTTIRLRLPQQNWPPLLPDADASGGVKPSVNA